MEEDEDDLRLFDYDEVGSLIVILGGLGGRFGLVAFIGMHRKPHHARLKRTRQEDGEYTESEFDEAAWADDDDDDGAAWIEMEEWDEEDEGDWEEDIDLDFMSEL